MTERIVHIIEPTLASDAGHCHSFVTSFCDGRKRDCDLRIYAGRGAKLPDLEKSGVRVFPHFRRRLRRLQALLLYRRLLREPGKVFLPTATRIDLALLSLAAGGAIPPRKAYLYFHWFRPDSGKREFLARMARRLPNVVVLCPTGSVADIFRGCGFRHASEAPYPITPVVPDGKPEGTDFRHLLYAGAARIDKGFPAVVDLVAYMKEKKSTVPVSVQASADHYERYEPRVRAEIDRLGKIGYPHLTVRFETLNGREYQEQFRGAVCLQPYDAADFADRVSGVTLDALSHGCPVVTVKGTWMGRVVDRFGAGRSADGSTPELLSAAAEEVIGDYPRYRRNALLAGASLQHEQSASRLFEIVAA